MKVCFLDFDGVLNSQTFINTTGNRCGIDPICVNRINALAERGVKFVLSTSWRIAYDVEYLNMFLVSHGFNGEIIGRTPILESSSYFGDRSKEIDTWLQENPVDNYVILDDILITINADHHVHTTFEYGLLDEHIVSALKILGE